MKLKLILSLGLSLLFTHGECFAQRTLLNIPFSESGHERHALDIYLPENDSAKNLPVIFWIHGGGWVVGDKNDVALKPKALTERGFVFVSTGYRLLPEVSMEVLISDVAKSLGWVHRHIVEYGGDPNPPTNLVWGQDVYLWAPAEIWQ